jgi:hypothetical protein
MKSWRRKLGQVLAASTVLLSLSGLAEAQQSGLLPLHPIRRQRVPCPNEDPIYKLYRNQYYGYFPTQWRKFPEGWNLPSPEGPNTRQVLKDNPIEGPKPLPSEEGEREEMEGPPERGGRQPIPKPIPEHERSPFEMDRPDSGAGAATGEGAPARRTPAPRSNTPPAGADPSPFDTPAARPGDAGATPDLTPPGAAPNAPPPRTSRNEDQGERAREKDPGPLLAMPDATLPTVEEASSPGGSTGGAAAEPVASSPVASAPATAPVAAQPAPRRGRLSSLFGGLGFNWMRR